MAADVVYEARPHQKAPPELAQVGAGEEARGGLGSLSPAGGLGQGSRIGRLPPLRPRGCLESGVSVLLVAGVSGNRAGLAPLAEGRVTVHLASRMLSDFWRVESKALMSGFTLQRVYSDVTALRLVGGTLSSS